MFNYFLKNIIFMVFFIFNTYAMILDPALLPTVPQANDPVAALMQTSPRPIVDSDSDDSSGSGPESPGKIAVVFGQPQNAQSSPAIAQAKVVTVHVGNDRSDLSRVEATEASTDGRNNQSTCRWILSCFSRCRAKKKSHTPQNKRSCAYIFFKNRCIQVVVSGAITLASTGASLYGAEKALDGLFSIGGNTAILSEILLGGLLYTVFLVTAQLLIYRFFEGSLSSQRILHGVGNAMLASVPACAVRSWFTVYPMSQISDSSLLLPVIVYTISGVVYLVFGVYKETCSPEPNMVLGKPLSDGYKIVLKNPFCAIQDAMNRRAEKILRTQGGLLEPFLCSQA